MPVLRARAYEPPSFAAPAVNMRTTKRTRLSSEGTFSRRYLAAALLHLLTLPRKRGTPALPAAWRMQAPPIPDATVNSFSARQFGAWAIAVPPPTRYDLQAFHCHSRFARFSRYAVGWRPSALFMYSCRQLPPCTHTPTPRDGRGGLVTLHRLSFRHYPYALASTGVCGGYGAQTTAPAALLRAWRNMRVRCHLHFVPRGARCGAFCLRSRPFLRPASFSAGLRVLFLPVVFSILNTISHHLPSSTRLQPAVPSYQTLHVA